MTESERALREAVARRRDELVELTCELAAPRERIVLEGEVPSPIDPPSGCRFHPRCPYATEVCRVERPPLLDHGGARLAACHHPLDGAIPIPRKGD